MPMRNLIFVAFMEPVAEGQVFPPTDWPLHITLLRFDVRFDAGTTEGADVAESIAGLADAPAAAALGTPLTVGADAGFGRDGSVPVSLVAPHPALQQLHEQLVYLVADAGGRVLTPGHTLAGYRPHISHHGSKRLHQGDAVVIDRVALVDMAPGGDHTIRRVLRLWSLGGGGG